MNKKKKRRTTEAEPLLDALFRQEEGFKLPVRTVQHMERKGDKILLITTFTARDQHKYKGEVVFTNELLKREPIIEKPQFLGPRKLTDDYDPRNVPSR